VCVHTLLGSYRLGKLKAPVLSFFFHIRLGVKVLIGLGTQR
jgi:hypothetical protein